MNIHFDPEELRSIFLEVIRSEFKSNVEHTLSKLSRKIIEEELGETQKCVEQSLSQLKELKKDVQETLQSVNMQCGKINEELTGVSTAGENPEDAVGLVEKTTLRQVLEEIHIEIKTLKAEIQDIRTEMNSVAAEVKREVSEPLASLSAVSPESQGGALLVPTTHAAMSTEEFLESLPAPSRGNSFNGMTLETISAGVPGNDSLTVQIVNYLDVPLENFHLYLRYGEECMKAPSSVPKESSEVFIIRGVGASQGVFSYQIDGTDYFLHSYFYSSDTPEPDTSGSFAFAFFPGFEPLETILRPEIAGYRHKGKPGSFDSRSKIPRNSKRTITAHQNQLYARGTFKTSPNAVITLEVYKRKP